MNRKVSKSMSVKDFADFSVCFLLSVLSLAKIGGFSKLAHSTHINLHIMVFDHIHIIDVHIMYSLVYTFVLM